VYQCPNCGSNITPGAKFCAACAFDLSQPYQTVPARGGAQTSRACQRCGTSVAPNAQFCPACALPLGVAGGYGVGPYSAGVHRPNRTPLIIGAVALSVVLIAGIVTLIVLLSRSGDSTTNGNTANANSSRGNQSTGPTKERAVQTLRDFLAAVEAGERDRAVAMVVLPPGMDVEKAKQELKDAKSVDLSSTGIDVLAQKGTWGKAKDVYPNQTRLNEIINKSGLPADSFYALTYRDVYVLYHWDGTKFKLVDLNDVDKLNSSS
jgi:Double zinc ribbon